MKTLKILTVLLILSCISCKTLEEKIENHKPDLYFTFLDCFDNDSIILLIKHEEIINVNNLSSTSLGSTKLSFEYYAEAKDSGIFIIKNGNLKTEKKGFVNRNKEYEMEIIRNGSSQKFNLHFDKKRKFIISGCAEDRKNVIIKSYTGKIVLE